MVFILIGAVKAVKQARVEYTKDKKRNAVISPVDGSHDMMADRASSPQRPGCGTTDWWGTTRAADAPDQTDHAPPNHNCVGVWSRDQVMQQISDANRERPSSDYAPSASARAELSAPVPGSAGSSASASPSDAVVPSSQRSADLKLPAAISHDAQGRDGRPDEHGASSLVKRSSQEVVSSGALVRRSSCGDDGRGTAPMKRISQADSSAAGKPQRAKDVVEGSFEAALRLIPYVKEERKPGTNPESTGEAVSALNRNGSKGLRKKPSRTGENSSAVVRNGSKGPVTIPERIEETDSCGAVSAPSRSAPKGPRRRLERSTKVPPAPGSFEASAECGGRRRLVEGSIPGAAGTGKANMESGVRRAGVEGSSDRTAGATGDLQKRSSAFAGAATKKRIGRRSPTNAQCGNFTSAAQPRTVAAGLAEPVITTEAGSTSLAGSSMYAEGSMKKRTSRR